MRFGLIGDIHAEDLLLEAAIGFLQRESVDKILSVGDIVDGVGDEDRTIELLREFKVEAVRGNHDRWRFEYPSHLPLSNESKTFLKSLPITRSYDTELGKMLLCHGFGQDDMIFLRDLDRIEDERERRRVRGAAQRLVAPDVCFVVCGHSHQRDVRRFGHVVLIDAGTLKNDDKPCFSIVDFSAGQIEFFDFHHGRVERSETLRVDFFRR